MLDRCKPNAHCHKRYYDRGIFVCDEWLNNFESFYEWAINNGYKDDLSLDRINNNEGYSPKNCRWATMKEQGNNRENNHLITINGKTQTLTQWAEESGIPISSIHRNSKKYKNKKILSVKFHRKTSKIAQYNLDGNIIKIWDSPIQIQKELNFPNRNVIPQVCKHIINTAYGYGWAYYPEDTWKYKPNPNEIKQITIDGETHNYTEWSKILKMTRDSFRRICYKYNFDSEKLSEYKKKRL